MSWLRPRRASVVCSVNVDPWCDEVWRCYRKACGNDRGFSCKMRRADAMRPPLHHPGLKAEFSRGEFR